MFFVHDTSYIEAGVINMSAQIQVFFDPATWTFTYVVHDGDDSPCLVIDSVLDYDPKSGRTHTRSADAVIAFVTAHHLKTEWILETHAHADHLSAAQYLKQELGGQIAIGAKIRAVQQVFKGIFNLEPSFNTDGQQFDYLLGEDEIVQCGTLSFQALFVPGHTPACMAYKVGDAIFVGDTMFMPDVGSARCDFPGGDAKVLFQSAQRLLSYPPETRLFMCHDYPPNERALQHETTVAEQKRSNIHLKDGITENAFVEMRTKRDATLEMPVLILPAVQINIRAGAMPPKEDNGVAYLKIPLNAL
jgi:glyoxylase-like metal-dependent hydrolase (beta-lactamase superfamily II)